MLDAAAAAGAGAARLYPGGNVAADFTLGYGDVDAAFARAATWSSRPRSGSGRHSAVPLEPRALLADARPGHRRAVDLRHDQGAGVQPRTCWPRCSAWTRP